MRTQHKRMQQETMCTQYIRNKYIKHDPSKPTATRMREKR